MLRDENWAGSREAKAPAASTQEVPAEPPRRGMPIDPARIVWRLKKGKYNILFVVFVSAVMGILFARFKVEKTYVSTATVLWEPAASAKSDPVRELSTLAQSIKLPANLAQVRHRSGTKKTLEALSKSLEVTQGENSMLLHIAAQENKPDKAARLANIAVEVFLDAQKETVAERLRITVRALRDSLLSAEKAYSESRARYDGFRAKHGVADPKSEVIASLESASKLRIEASRSEIDLAGVNAKSSILSRIRDRTPALVITAKSESSPLEIRRGELEADLVRARSKMTDEHPTVKRLVQELAEVIRATGKANPTETGRTLGRSSLRDAIDVEFETSRAERAATEARRRALDRVREDVESHVRQISPLEGEAAKLLAAVQADETHVSNLLHQISRAEDDVRTASAGFQIISRADEPTFPKKSMARIVAMAMPALAFLIIVCIYIFLELRSLRIRTARELAFWGQGQVLASTNWPVHDLVASAQTNLSRALADVCMRDDSIVGVAAFGGIEQSRIIAQWIEQRLRLRGEQCTLIDSSQHDDKLSLVEAMEHRRFDQKIRKAVKRGRVILILPSWIDHDAMQVAANWVSCWITTAQESSLPMFDLKKTAQSMITGGRSLHWILTHISTTPLGPERVS